jgi:hypothetical protein
MRAFLSRLPALKGKRCQFTRLDFFVNANWAFYAPAYATPLLCPLLTQKLSGGFEERLANGCISK